MFTELDRLLKDIYREFSWKYRLTGASIGILAYMTMLMEVKRLSKGWQYEPACFYEENDAALAVKSTVFKSFLPKLKKNTGYLAEPKPLR